MHKLFISLVIIGCSFRVTAQNNKMVDSLLKALDATQADSVKMKIYRQLGEYYTDNNAAKAIGFLDKSQEIAKRMNRPLLIANNYYSIGFCYLIKSDFNKSLESYLEALRIYEQLKDSFRLSNTYLSIGNLYSENKNFKKTNEYYDKATVLIEAQKDSFQLASILMQRGTLYDQHLKQYDTALIYLKKAEVIARFLKDNYLITNTMGNIGLTYKHQLNNLKALEYFDTVLTMYKKMDVPVDNYAAIYNNIAATLSQAGSYLAAKTAFDQSIRFSLKAGSPFLVMENYNNLSDMYKRMKDYRLQAEYLEKFYKIKDSLFTADNKNQLTQLEADYRIEKKNTELIKKDTEVIKQKGQRNIFIIITIAVALLLLTLLFFFKRTKTSNQLLLQKNAQINQQKNELETLNQVKDRLFSIISHDLRNPLVTFRTYLSLADDINLSADKKELFKTTTMQAVIQTCDMLDNLLVWANMQIKNAKVSITPIDIGDCTLDVINTVQVQANQKRIHIQQHLPVSIALGDYTIVTIALRNIITNAIKFSHSGTTIYIDSEKRVQQVFIKIKDEGIGMTGEQLGQLNSNQTDSTIGTNSEKGSGLGIFLVKELLQKINGKLVIESEYGNGSSFTIVLEGL
jgi:signal transduction histidine kinase